MEYNQAMSTLSFDSKPLNKDAIKYIAMVTMLLNHAAMILLQDSFIKELLMDIGYFTFPVMAYFLVEGYGYTRSKKKYALRLFIFTIISQLPYSWNVGVRLISFDRYSIFYTLLCCFLIICSLDMIERRWLRYLSVTLLIALSLFGDWQVLAPLLTIGLYKAKGDKEKIIKAFLFPTLLMVVLMTYGSSKQEDFLHALLYGAMTAIGPIFAMFTIVYLYNGKRMERGKNFSKWFFYIFYPLHLVVLKFIKLLLIS